MFLDICDLFHKNALSDSFQLNKRYKFKKDLFSDCLEGRKMYGGAPCRGIILKESWFLILSLGWMTNVRHLNRETVHDQSPRYIRDIHNHVLSQSNLVRRIDKTSWCSRQLLNLNKCLFRAQSAHSPIRLRFCSSFRVPDSFYLGLSLSSKSSEFSSCSPSMRKACEDGGCNVWLSLASKSQSRYGIYITSS